MTVPLISKTLSTRIDELFSARDYEGVKEMFSENSTKISTKLRTRVLIDFLMISNGLSDPMYESVDLKKAKKFYEYAVWIRSSGDTLNFQGNTNVLQLIGALEKRFPEDEKRLILEETHIDEESVLVNESPKKPATKFACCSCM